MRIKLTRTSVDGRTSVELEDTMQAGDRHPSDALLRLDLEAKLFLARQDNRLQDEPAKAAEEPAAPSFVYKGKKPATAKDVTKPPKVSRPLFRPAPAKETIPEQISA